jgi:hypothetical protein
MKFGSQLEQFIGERKNYFMVTTLIVVVWSSLRLLPYYLGSVGEKTEYIGSMVVVFLWANFMRFRMTSAGKNFVALLPYAATALLLGVVLMKFRIDPPMSLLGCLFLAQIPALFFGERRAARTAGGLGPGDGSKPS